MSNKSETVVGHFGRRLSVSSHLPISFPESTILSPCELYQTSLFAPRMRTKSSYPSYFSLSQKTILIQTLFGIKVVTNYLQVRLSTILDQKKLVCQDEIFLSVLDRKICLIQFHDGLETVPEIIIIYSEYITPSRLENRLQESTYCHNRIMIREGFRWKLRNKKSCFYALVS